MSAAKDYEALRSSRRTRINTAVKQNTRIAFMDCKNCGYYWSKQVTHSKPISCICPKCCGDAVEV